MRARGEDGGVNLCPGAVAADLYLCSSRFALEAARQQRQAIRAHQGSNHPGTPGKRRSQEPTADPAQRYTHKIIISCRGGDLARQGSIHLFFDPGGAAQPAGDQWSHENFRRQGCGYRVSRHPDHRRLPDPVPSPGSLDHAQDHRVSRPHCHTVNEYFSQCVHHPGSEVL